MKIKVGVSNRHIHLTEDAYRLLFEKNLTKKTDLSQPGQFSSEEVLTIEANGKKIDNVRIVGPFRKYNQVEISRRDARFLGINPPVRKSGDLKDACDIIISNEQGRYKLKDCCIIANRHVHISNSYAKELRLKDNDEVKIVIPKDKGGIVKAFIKTSDDAVLELHIDTDDANAFNLNTGDEVELIL